MLWRILLRRPAISEFEKLRWSDMFFGDRTLGHS
ncbi:MAG: hypothetical protein ACJA16_001844 [Akkermansiaceae bacterium]|jgi:hypothetical protein